MKNIRGTAVGLLFLLVCLLFLSACGGSNSQSAIRAEIDEMLKKSSTTIPPLCIDKEAEVFTLSTIVVTLRSDKSNSEIFAGQNVVLDLRTVNEEYCFYPKGDVYSGQSLLLDLAVDNGVGKQLVVGQQAVMSIVFSASTPDVEVTDVGEILFTNKDCSDLYFIGQTVLSGTLRVNQPLCMYEAKDQTVIRICKQEPCSPVGKDAICGTATSKTFETVPDEKIENLCRNGAATAVVKDSAVWKWSCLGRYGGKNVACQAAASDDGALNCGNGKIDGKEVCDFGEGKNTGLIFSLTDKLYTSYESQLPLLPDQSLNLFACNQCKTVISKTLTSLCGNGIIDGDEQCDFRTAHNNNNEKSLLLNADPTFELFTALPYSLQKQTTIAHTCSNACVKTDVSVTNNYCGDMIVQSAVTPPETCDDGNTINTDACSNSCQTRGVVSSGVCQIKYKPGGCDVGELGILSLYDFTNSNAAEYTPTLDYHLCCKINGKVTIQSEQCKEAQIVSLIEKQNSHVSQFASPIAPNRVCIESYDGFAQCQINTLCTPQQVCVASISSSDALNSHVGSCNELGRNVCCTFNQPLTVEGIKVCGIDYICGATDGICPENFLSDDGSSISCSNIYDSDCTNSAFADGSVTKSISLQFKPASGTHIDPARTARNDLAQQTYVKEFTDEAQTLYMAQIVVHSDFKHATSTTTVGFVNIVALQTVLFDMHPINVCGATIVAPCYTYSGGLLTVHHSLSTHLITAQFELEKPLDLGFLFTTIILYAAGISLIVYRLVRSHRVEKILFDQVGEYIKLQKTRGLSDQAIRKKLIAVGWNEKNISEEFGRFEQIRRKS